MVELRESFVFGKHSGAGAVEKVLKKHASRLEAQGIKADEDFVKRLLDKAKELREEGLVELAMRMHAEERARV
jgi:hypothetical protein